MASKNYLMNLTSLPTDQPSSVQQVFQSWEGKWRFQRNLNNQATMQGIASFTKTSALNAYAYEEKGKVYRQNSCLRAYKNYVYTFHNNQIALYFMDAITKQQGELLYQLHFPSIDALYAYGTHYCRADTYQAYYEFLHAHAFQLTYQVTGPRKNWLIQTHFLKLSDT